ncbi:MAG: 7,8-dihydropterin-6-yl-methyl-4-(beta-D-ribofuranosyl)aminobenzene 5-phosphate synthase [Chloroflexota bacterium]|nr:7,8-dihydropterin-6-yl-methyl-4-(beta-D-ribofuranosyl)aminobenzene 5-phosphate synthase [Chloroflexota bacterium]
MDGIKIISVVNDMALPGSGLRSEHGLCMWIDTPAGIALWDSGGSGEVLQHNLATLSLDPAAIQVLALSHAHDDHIGGLDYLLRVRPDVPVVAHPDIFRPRYSRKNGEYLSRGLPQRSQLLREHASLNLSAEPVEILPGLWTSGEIRSRPEWEGRSANHFIQVDGEWEADPYQDDMSLVLETDEGLILICGCCHAGLLNTLYQVRAQFQLPVQAILGGTHLISADGAMLEHVVDVLAAEFPETDFYLNHCSGPDAVQRLQTAFGERVREFRAGCVFESEA